jgi:hypothetical protein
MGVGRTAPTICSLISLVYLSPKIFLLFCKHDEDDGLDRTRGCTGVGRRRHDGPVRYGEILLTEKLSLLRSSERRELRRGETVMDFLFRVTHSWAYSNAASDDGTCGASTEPVSLYLHAMRCG